MTSFWRCSFLAVLVTFVVSCGEEQSSHPIPGPHEISSDAVGHFCGMLLEEHPGPKGQILLRGQAEPVWFTSAIETFAFTMLDEEPKNIAAIYVTDMGRAESWDKPGPGTWIDARKAIYVIASRVHGGMGGNEAVPFSNPEQAKQFIAQHGGHIVSFEAMPRSYILQQSEELAGKGDADAHFSVSGPP